MIRALNTGVMGMRQFQTSLDVIGNNLANINTVAYKGARAEFADTLSQTMRAPTPDTATTSGSVGMQIGNGMQVSAIKNTFTQGAMKNTGVRTDMAINGKGFFLVKDPTTNELFATRAGDFREDKNGYLVTNDGYRVQGKNKLSPAYIESQKQEIGDLKLDAGQYTADRTGVSLDYVSNVLTKQAHGLTTGNQVKFSSILPAIANDTNSTDTVFFINKLTDDTLTLHKTAADAATGANKVNFTDDTTTAKTGFTTDVANDKITLAGHGLASGDSVYVKDGTIPGGLTPGTHYYVGVSDGGVTTTTNLTRGALSTADKWNGTNTQEMTCELGATSGNIEFRWDNYSAVDKIEIFYEGQKIWHTGANPLTGAAETVAGPGSASIAINGTSNQLTIKVNDGLLTSGSAWEMYADGGISITPKSVSETSLVANSAVSFHTTSADATAGTNVVNLTEAGLDFKLYKDSGILSDISLTGGASLSQYSFGPDGRIKMLLTDGTQYDRGQVLLQIFKNEQSLVKTGSNRFENLSAAGAFGVEGDTPAGIEIVNAALEPGKKGAGRIVPGALELSNVDMADEFSRMIIVQRAFQANARVISTSDEILREMMALKR